MRQRERAGEGFGIYDGHRGEQMREGEGKNRGLLHPMKVGVKKSKAS